MIHASFTKQILAWYHQNKRDLPWRHTQDPYRIWISEMMLQQTTVVTVIPFYDKWFRLFPTVHDLAKAPLETVLKAWQGLGYYNRARNLHKTANIIVSEHKGILPKDPLTVRAMPGFGPYATASVLSIAYEIPLALIDANVRRVFMRLMAVKGISSPALDKTFLPILERLLPNKEVGNFNQALMELGALVCKPKNPLCLSCPVKQHCQAYDQGTQEIIPELNKKVIQEIHAAIGIIKDGKKYFIQQRANKGLLANMWEFPGGKIEKGEEAKTAVTRELKEELNITVSDATYLCAVTHFYTQFKVKLSVWQCTVKPKPKTDNTHRWVTLEEMSKYPMPSGSARFVVK